MKRQQKQKQKCVEPECESESSNQESDSEFIITESSESEKQKSKTFWSLKGLSYQIKNLVNELKTTTYKQLANILIERLQNELQKIQIAERKKEIQNLKRRVYDAINVMVAMGVLTKDKKLITFQGKQYDKEELNYQIMSVHNKQQYIREKRKKLTKATLTYMKHKQLANRNQLLKTNEDFVVATPVIAFSIQLNDNDLIMQQKYQNRLIIKSKQPIYIYSELEILQKILN